MEKNDIDMYIWNNIYKSNINNKLNINELKDNVNKDKITERYNEIEEYRKSLNKLKNLPLIKQRPEEWHKLRSDRLTASDLYDAINENNTTILKKKILYRHNTIS